MARVYIAEPDPHLRELYRLTVEQLGHDVLVRDPETVPEVDLLILEPADKHSLAVADALRAKNPNLPIISSSILAPTTETKALRLCAHLVKPYSLTLLEQAVEQALRGRD